MNNALFIAAIVIVVLAVLIGLVLVKEVRTHLFWRRLVAEDDADVIGQILENEIERWRIMRPPKGISAAVWTGVQGMELQAGSRRLVQVSTTAEAEFRLVEGQRTQVAGALDTAFAVAARLIEMILYDIPDFRPAAVRVDVYTTFRSESGVAEPRPILSLTADRQAAAPLAWDVAPAEEIIAAFHPLYRLSEQGDALPIALPPPPEEPRPQPAAGTEAQDRSAPVS